ncbi:MAG TPA: GNAT family N-acetyltransferase [Chryseosolibacter sp.]|nr:GNAT family N-acetyltransferase [Chryseosolibacter sp.]
MPTEFYISTDKTKLDLNIIEDFLTKQSYWAKGRSRKTIIKAIQNSLCFGVFTGKGDQVGFARVVSDYAVFAWIMDVFILEPYQKKGLGKLLMEEIMNHAELQGLQRWGLRTNDAHGLYKKFGFRELEEPEYMMEKANSPS